LFLDQVPGFGNLTCPAVIYIGWGEVVQRLVYSLVVVILHKLTDLVLQLPGQIIVLQIDDIFHGAVIPFDFALGHGVIGPGPSVLDAVFTKINSQCSCKIAGSVITEQPGTMPFLWGGIELNGMGRAVQVDHPARGKLERRGDCKTPSHFKLIY
jgi:hypothetical protein